MSLKRTCDMCNGPRKVSRYTMAHKTREHNDADPDRVSSISAGGIDLCEECWTRIARPRKGRGGHQHRLINKCDRCKETFDGYKEPLRYTLKVSVRREEDGKVVTRGAGGVVLCHTCWRKVGYSKMRNRAKEPHILALTRKEVS